MHWLLNKVHPSWFIGCLCSGYLIGVASVLVIVDYEIQMLLWLILLCILFIVVRRCRITILVVIVLGLMAGFWRGQYIAEKNSKYQNLYGSMVSVSGKVSQDVSYGLKGDQRITLTDIKIHNEEYAGKLWISAHNTEIKRGDNLKVSGNLSPGFGNLSGAIYKANIIEINRPNPGDVTRKFRDWFADSVRRGIPNVQASLGLGYLVGLKSALPPELEEDIKATGLTHVVVASGYNLTILVIFCRSLFLRISKFIATLASLLMIGSFMLITGLSPSMTRAGLVAALGLLVWYYGRKTHPFVLLSLAAAVTVIVDPTYIWGDLGWYLSFTAFIGVLVLAPLLQAYYWGPKKPPNAFWKLIIETSSAQIVTTPIILGSFGLFATYALLANLLVLPLVPIAMLLTFIAGVAGFLTPNLATILSYPATLTLTYSTSVISKVASLPNAQIEIEFNPELIIASYILLGALITYLIRRTKFDFRNTHEDGLNNL